MTQADLPDFIAELERVSELYTKPMTEALQALYFDALAQYPMQDVTRAFRLHIRSPEQGRFFPKPADLIALLDGDSASRALQAWTTAVQAWEEHGIYQSVAFADPCIAATIEDMGGWIAFHDRYMLLKEEPFMRQEFVKRYLGYLQSPPRRAIGALPGIHALENTRRGMLDAVPEPIAIGAAPKRLAILEGAKS